MLMPIIRPLPIETRGMPLLAGIWTWLTSIRKWEVMEYWQFTLPDGFEIIIPKGFVFDGASVPRLLWWLFSPTGLLFIPGLIHDYAYKHNYLLCMENHGPGPGYRKGVGRANWDRLFFQIGVEVNGVWIANALAYAALVVGGGFAWRKHRKADA